MSSADEEKAVCETPAKGWSKLRNNSSRNPAAQLQSVPCSDWFPETVFVVDNFEQGSDQNFWQLDARPTALLGTKINSTVFVFPRASFHSPSGY